MSATSLLPMKNLFRGLLVGWVFGAVGWAQPVVRDLRYAEAAHERQVLDVYAPAGAKGAPVVFWVHGGGWQGGDKGRRGRRWYFGCMAAAGRAGTRGVCR